MRWVDAPPKSAKRTSQQILRNAAAELFTHPGRWAIVIEYKSRDSANSTARRISRGESHWNRARYNAEVRRTTQGRYAVYAVCDLFTPEEADLRVWNQQ
jgi:hypothetical protein